MAEGVDSSLALGMVRPIDIYGPSHLGEFQCCLLRLLIRTQSPGPTLVSASIYSANVNSISLSVSANGLSAEAV